MKKLRKMLGSPEQAEILAIMRLIETQSKSTIANWCLDYAAQNLLPVFEKEKPDDSRPKVTLDGAKAWLRGEVKLAEVKDMILNMCHAAARESEDNPAAQAAARAIGQAASSIHAATHALGLAFYSAAAMAYSKAGTQADEDTYNNIATDEFVRIYKSLKSVAVENEKNPAKVKWNC